MLALNWHKDLRVKKIPIYLGYKTKDLKIVKKCDIRDTNLSQQNYLCKRHELLKRWRLLEHIHQGASRIFIKMKINPSKL